MNRTITYPGALPKSADFLNAQRNTMISDGAILQAVFGTSAVASGFTCAPLAVPGMGVQVSAGALTQYTTVDATAYGELAADLTEFTLKQGINLDPTTLTMAAPTSAGQSIAYLIEAAFAEVDGTPVVLPYVNAANPSQPYAGPTNSGVAQNTTRDETVTLMVKAGAAAATGSQTPPAADAGYVPLFVVTVAYGQTAITTSNIAQHPSAPFLQANLVTMPARLPGVVGTARNAKMSVTEASATATFTADELVVATSLGGVPWCLGTFSEVINLATTGAGGMDVGSAPVSGYVALYAIYNPTAGATALLATNATSSVAPNVYGGTAMPSGYTASALVSVWPTNASGLLVVGYQTDRAIYISGVVVLATSTQSPEGTYLAFGVAGAVPMNAKSCSGSALIVTSASAANLAYAIAGSSSGVGVAGGAEQAAQTNGGIQGSIGEIPVMTPQTLYYYATASAGTMTFNVDISGYRI
jgi:hypothetical protein